MDGCVSIHIIPVIFYVLRSYNFLFQVQTLPDLLNFKLSDFTIVKSLKTKKFKQHNFSNAHRVYPCSGERAMILRWRSNTAGLYVTQAAERSACIRSSPFVSDLKVTIYIYIYI